MIQIFNDKQRERAQKIMASSRARMDSLSRPEIKELACVWSYYNGKIEGCTYSYAETEGLLKDGITPAKTWEEAKMLKNLHNTFMYEMQQILEHGAKPVLDERRLLSLASGTDIVNPQEIARIIYEQYQIENPLERAVYLHCNIARTQPFADCNKRTSRLVEAIELMAAGFVPCYSAMPADVIAYRNAIIHYYETEDYSEYADYFLSKLEGRIE